MKRILGRRTGFTFIELLVAVSIITLLTSIAVTRFTGSQQRVHDARRIADLAQIRTALELYRADNGFYPPSACGWDCNGYRMSNAGDSWIPELVSGGYMQKVPLDPKNTGGSPWADGNNYLYAYGNVGRTTYGATYDLTAHLEDTSNPDRCGVKNWRYYFTDQAWCVAFGGTYSNQIYEASPN